MVIRGLLSLARGRTVAGPSPETGIGWDKETRRSGRRFGLRANSGRNDGRRDVAEPQVLGWGRRMRREERDLASRIERSKPREGRQAALGERLDELESLLWAAGHRRHRCPHRVRRDRKTPCEEQGRPKSKARDQRALVFLESYATEA